MKFLFGVAVGAVCATAYFAVRGMIEFLEELDQVGPLDLRGFDFEPEPDDPDDWFDWAHDLGLI